VRTNAPVTEILISMARSTFNTVTGMLAADRNPLRGFPRIGNIGFQPWDPQSFTNSMSTPSMERTIPPWPRVSDDGGGGRPVGHCLAAGHRAHTEETVLQNKTSDRWAYYQAKNIRMHEDEVMETWLRFMVATDTQKAALVRDKYKAEADRYRGEKSEMKPRRKNLKTRRTGKADAPTVSI